MCSVAQLALPRLSWLLPLGLRSRAGMTSLRRRQLRAIGNVLTYVKRSAQSWVQDQAPTFPAEAWTVQPLAKPKATPLLPAGSSLQRAHSNTPRLSCGQAEMPGEVNSGGKKSSYLTTQQTARASRNSGRRSGMPRFLHDVRAAASTGADDVLGWTAKDTHAHTRLEVEPHRNTVFDFSPPLVWVCIQLPLRFDSWGRCCSRVVMNLKINPDVKGEGHCRGDNSPERPGLGCCF